MNGFEDRDDDAEDRLLSALLAAPRAEANPAVWARVRTRLAAAPVARPAGALDRLLDWLMRPAAVAAATAALVVALGAGWSVLDTLGIPATPGDSVAAATEATSLMESLLDPTASSAAAGEETPAGDATAAPGDSGGRS